MPGMATSPLTIVDPSGRLTLDDVQEFISIIGGDTPLRVTSEGFAEGRSVFCIDFREQPIYDYHGEEINMLILHFMLEYLPRGCEFSECPEMWQNLHNKTADVLVS